jgi:hypothetical protein
MLPRLNLLRVFRSLLLWLLLTRTAAGTEPLGVKEERLGAWHYLYPLEYHSGGDAKHTRATFPPTAIAFANPRESVAVLLPGSRRLAEFRAGTFTDLALPEAWQPLSLAADQEGKLWMLAQFAEYEHRPKDAWRRRFLLRHGEEGWEKEIAIPYDRVDLVEFDSADRLWALGSGPEVAFYREGRWEKYAFSEDRKLEFLPMRIGRDDANGVVLFSLPEPYPSGEYSRMPGSLVYRAGKFSRQRTTDPAWTTAVRTQAARLSDDSDLARRQGYVTHAESLNMPNTPRTVVRAGGAIVVSFGNSGLAWTMQEELKNAPPLPNNEWEAIRDVSAPPTLDPAQNLWVGRSPQLIKIGPEKTERMSGELPKFERERTIDLDQLGRPWVMRWHGAMEGAVTVAHEGKLLHYANLAEGLRAESPRFQPGRIFDFAVKAPDGTLLIVSGFSEECMLIDQKGIRTFSADQINPRREEVAGHGYNPFRGAEPWYDAEGRLYTKSKGESFRWESAHGRWVAAPKAGPSVLPPLRPERGDFAGPFRASISRVGKPEIVYEGFHFYEAAEGGKRQIDFGVNPLAYYPFWTGWYRSPGQTTPVVDPTGAIWVSPRGPYAEGREWWVLRARR